MNDSIKGLTELIQETKKGVSLKCYARYPCKNRYPHKIRRPVDTGRKIIIG